MSFFFNNAENEISQYSTIGEHLAEARVSEENNKQPKVIAYWNRLRDFIDNILMQQNLLDNKD